VGQLVERFNREGLAALTPGHGGGAKTQYDSSQRQQMIELAQQPPDLETDGVSQWSLAALQRRLRSQEDGKFSTLSTYTLWQVLHEAGQSWQQSRSWCKTGTALRRRKTGVVLVSDPDTEAKKT
jgi:transposase